MGLRKYLNQGQVLTKMLILLDFTTPKHKKYFEVLWRL